jgi:hypothetical protein
MDNFNLNACVALANEDKKIAHITELIEAIKNNQLKARN